MKKLLFLLSITLIASAIANTDTDRIKILEEENAQLREFKIKQENQENDKKIFIAHLNALLKNGALVGLGAAAGGILVTAIITKKFMKSFGW